MLRYHEVMARIDGRLGPDYMLDEFSRFSFWGGRGRRAGALALSLASRL